MPACRDWVGGGSGCSECGGRENLSEFLTSIGDTDLRITFPNHALRMIDAFLIRIERSFGFEAYIAETDGYDE